MSSTAEYFRIKLYANNQLNVSIIGKSEEECKKEYVKQLIKETKELANNNELFENENNFIEISDVDDRYIFGIIGKSSTIKQSPLRRIKDIKGEQIRETNLSMEDYRYFLLDTQSLRCIVIKNPTAPAFKMLFRNFLMKFNDSLLSNITVNPILDEDLNSKFKRFNNIVKMNLIFNNDSSLSSQIGSLKDTLYISNESTRKISLSIWLKDQKINENMIKLMEDEEFIQGEFEKFEIQGFLEEDKKETLEFVDKLLTKCIDIELSNEALIDGEKYLDEIKKALIRGL